MVSQHARMVFDHSLAPAAFDKIPHESCQNIRGNHASGAPSASNQLLHAVSCQSRNGYCDTHATASNGKSTSVHPGSVRIIRISEPLLLSKSLRHSDVKRKVFVDFVAYMYRSGPHAP